MSLQVTEPHPTTRPNTYIHTGRGGAGNMYKTKSPSIASTTPSTARAAAASSAKFSSGRGGAGNILPLALAAPYSLADEAAAQQSREMRHKVWHVGRGGAGNCGAKEKEPVERKGSAGSSGSEGTAGEGRREGFLGRLSGAFERR